jgi:polysaccharide pyruvyl transferase WcaK-like protein
MTRRVFVLSASDRFNYGDLLFPIIAHKQLEQEFEVVNTAIVRTNLVELGALPTVPYGSLYQRRGNLEPRDAILVAGGEVLGSDWATLYSYVSPAFRRIYDLFAVRRTTRRGFERVVRSVLGHSEPVPFVPSRDSLLEEVDFFFHAVGGCDTHESEHRDNVKKVFDRACYISAREEDTTRSIKEGLGCEKVVLTPDSAILMSDYYPKRPSPSGTGYICYQMRGHHWEEHLPVVRDQLDRLAERTGRHIVLLSIGNCPGHDDQVPLQVLNKELKARSTFVKPQSIEAVMMTIANSDLYLGTSLHGVITAMSFQVPYLGLDPSILKIPSYLRTWAPPALQQATAFSGICEAGEAALRVERESLERSLENQKQRVRQSFLRIRELLKGGVRQPAAVVRP